MDNSQNSRRLPSLKALRALEAIHLTGSVTGAAQQLNVSHSAISHQVRILEDWSTTPLFSRNGRTTILTEAGRSLAATTHRAFDEVRHEVDRLPLRQVNPVTIATLPLLATEIILPQIYTLTKNEPDIRLHVSLTLSDRPTSPTPDLETLFLRRSTVLANDIILFTGDAIPACAPALIKQTGLTAEDLITVGPYIHDEDLRMWPAWFEQHRPEIQGGLVDEPSNILLEGSLLINTAVSEGLGVGFVRRALVKNKLASGELVACTDAAIDLDWVYVLRIAADRTPDPKVERVVSWLKNICS